MRRGRRRKQNAIRDRTGKSRGEPDTIAPEVLAVRARDLMRDNVSPAHANDALAGFTLGRLLLRNRADRSDPGSITQRQYDAGDDWSKIVRAHARVMGYSLSRPSPSFVMVGTGFSCASDPEAGRGAPHSTQIFRLLFGPWSMPARYSRVRKGDRRRSGDDLLGRVHQQSPDQHPVGRGLWEFARGAQCVGEGAEVVTGRSCHELREGGLADWHGSVRALARNTKHRAIRGAVNPPAASPSRIVI